MKKEEFKNILPEHFESCRQIIVNNNGECDYVDCVKFCPFYEENMTAEDDYIGCAERFPDLVKAAKEFLKFEKELKKNENDND